MFKILSLFIILSITGYITIWIKKHPGEIAIEWQGWLIETSVPVIVSITILLFLTLIIIYWLSKKIFSIPKFIHKKYKIKKTKKANTTIIRALSAKSMGEMELAEKLSKEAKYLNNSPLKLLLDSELNNYNNNEDVYIADLKKMVGHPETMLLGLKSLSNFYLNKGDIKEAINIIRKAPRSKNTPSWFFMTALKFNILEKNWDDIVKNIEYIEKYTKISKTKIKILKSRIYLFKALEFNQEKGTESKYIDIALKFDSSFAPAIILKAKLLYKKDDKLALNFIKKSWKKFPHPDIANFITEIYSDKPKIELLNIAKNLMKLNNNTYLNNVTLAKVAISIGSWTVARQALKIIPEENWTKNIYLMMSDLEKKEHGNISKSNYWITKAEGANLDYFWGCTACTYVSKSWHLVCPECQNVDTIRWQQFSLSKSSINKNNSLEKIKAKGVIGELNIGIDR